MSAPSVRSTARRLARPALLALAVGLGALGAVLPALAQTAATATAAQDETFPINLNTATDAQILAIPGLGQRMLREFKEYRPYVNVEQFRRDIGKYVSQEQVEKYLQYVFVPTNPNTATEAQLTALKGVDRAMAAHIVANRSYANAAALRAALARRYDARTIAALERYWVFS